MASSCCSSNVTPTPVLDEIIALSGETEIPKVMKIFFEQQIAEEEAFTKYIRDKIADVKASLTRLPSKIVTMLYPHPREGLNWLWSLHCKGKGDILGDDMGLGKTMQICSFLAGLFHSNLTKRVLVVATKTLLPHWKQELAVVDLAGKTKEYNGTCAKARHYELQHILQNNGVLLTTYDFVIKIANALSNEHKNDVGHLIKNPNAKKVQSLFAIPCAHRIIITGTPIQNNLMELWTLFNFACPGLLGDKKCFKEQYEAVILRGRDKNASDRDQRIGSAIAQELRECIQPYFLRLLKDEVFRGDDGMKVYAFIIMLAVFTLGLGPGCIFTLTSIAKWECSSYGRALALHARGTRFNALTNSLLVASLCKNQDEYPFWDVSHPTENAMRLLVPVTLISRLDISDPLHSHPNDYTALTHTIHILKQNSSSIADYYHKLNALWKQFDAMVELPKYVCNASDSFKKHNQLMKLMQFLMGLDDSYMQIKSSILSREVFPDIRSTYATIFSEESHKLASGNIVVPIKGINLLHLQGEGSALFCKNCSFNGHSTDRCFKIIGYPANFGKKKFGQNFKGKNVANNNSIGTGSSSGFTDEQMTTLISLIKDNKSKVIVNGKIVDSWANQHMTNSDKNLDNVYDISHLKIKVAHPNGTKAFISKIGNFKLPNGLILFDVLMLFFESGFESKKSSRDWLGHPTDPVLSVLKDNLGIENKSKIEFCETCQRTKQTREPFPLCDHKSSKLDSASKEVDTSNVFQDLNHTNLFDIKYLEMPCDDERVDPKLNSDQKSQSDSSHSSESGRNMNTIDFIDDKSVNDAQSNDDIFATQDEQVTTLKDNNNNSEANLDQNPNVSLQATQNLKRSSRQSVFPKNYNDFVVDSKIDAMTSKMDDLLRNDTWEIVDLPKDKKAIGSKWIFKIKYKSSGETDRYKARLVAQEFGKKEGIDYEQIFSHVVKMVTIRCLLNVVVSNSWHVYQLDVNNAFLYGDLIKTVYMKPPEGYFSSKDKVCKLKKYLYGLKQEPRQWNAKLTSTLIENGFSQSKSDYSVYTKSDKGVLLALLVYVDDIIINGNKFYEINKFKVYRKSKFMIKDLGKLKYFLGIEVIDTSKGICLNQRKYMLDLLSKYGIFTCKPTKTPLMYKLIISNKATDNDHILDNITNYQKLIGLGIHIIKDSGMNLKAFSDADLAKSRNKILSLNPQLKQSTELLLQLPVNNFAIKIVANPVFHERTKHLEIDLHFVREKILKGVVKTIRVESANQIADILTKGLDTVQHNELVKRLGIFDIY
ncbi:ribonuclease H-like domain-containing protein [Tanacetum coccineum]